MLSSTIPGTLNAFGGVTATTLAPPVTSSMADIFHLLWCYSPSSTDTMSMPVDVPDSSTLGIDPPDAAIALSPATKLDDVGVYAMAYKMES
jgi:hypothetical protein